MTRLDQLVDLFARAIHEQFGEHATIYRIKPVAGRRGFEVRLPYSERLEVSVTSHGRWRPADAKPKGVNK